MIWAMIGCGAGLFVIGYIVGSDRGYRQAHAKIVSQQLVRSNTCDKPNCQKTGTCKKKEHARSKIKKLRIIRSQGSSEE